MIRPSLLYATAASILLFVSLSYFYRLPTTRTTATVHEKRHKEEGGEGASNTITIPYVGPPTCKSVSSLESMQLAVGQNFQTTVTATGDHFLELKFPSPSQVLVRKDIMRLLLGRRLLFLGNSNLRIVIETILYSGSNLRSTVTRVPFTFNYPKNKAAKIRFYGSSLSKELSHSGFFVESKFSESMSQTDVQFCPDDKVTDSLLSYDYNSTDQRYLFCDICSIAAHHCDKSNALLAYQFTSTPQVGSEQRAEKKSYKWTKTLRRLLRPQRSRFKIRRHLTQAATASFPNSLRSCAAERY